MGSQGVTALNLFKVTVILLITGTYVLRSCINTAALSLRRHRGRGSEAVVGEFAFSLFFF